MKKLICILVLGLFLSENVFAEIKVHSSNADIIRIVTSKFSATNKIQKIGLIESSIVKYATNHCESYKKNTYYFFKNKYGSITGKIKGAQFDFFVDKKALNSLWAYQFYCADNLEDAKALQIFKYSSENSTYGKAIWDKSKSRTLHYDIIRTLSKAEKKAQMDEFNRLEDIKEKEREIRAIKKKEALALAAAKKRKQKVSSLELSYGKECSGSMFSKGFTKGTKEYQNCLFAKEKEMIVRQKALEIKLAKMTPIQRREYNCEQTFKFRKGTNPFNQCVFKLYTTELEIEKLELQKQVAEANERAALAQAKAASSETARKEAIANAQISAANAQVAAAKASARASSLASSIELMRMGSSMMKSPAPAPSGMGRVRTTCRNVGGFLNCY